MRLGVVSEIKLPTTSLALDVIYDTLRTRLDELLTRRGMVVGDTILRTLAAAAVERLRSDNLLPPD